MILLILLYVELESTEAIAVIQGLILIELFACLISYLGAVLLAGAVSSWCYLKRKLTVILDLT